MASLATSQSWYFVKHFWNGPPAVGLRLQLLCSHIANRNFREKTKQNIKTMRMPHLWSLTVWGSRSRKMFCSMFSRSSPCLLGQHGSCSSAKLPVELSNVTKSFPYPAAPLCRVVPRFIMIICNIFCYNSNLGSCLHWKILVGGAISSRQTEQSKSLSKMDERSGGNCIKISLPGKLILIKRKGLREVLFSWK